jgi:hypothetical protein
MTDMLRSIVPRRNALPLLLPFVLFAAAGCDKSQAYGEANSIIVGTTDEIWSEVGDLVVETLEPRIVTVRDERTLRLTHQNVEHPDWSRLKIFRQVLVIGTADDPWVAEPLDYVRGNAAPAPPQILQASNVWARGQLVTILLLPEPERLEPRDGVAAVADSLSALLDRQFRQFVNARMFVSGRDTTLARELRENAGFSLLLPQVYRWDVQDSVYKFRNDNPDPSELIREIGVTWRDIGTDPPTQDEILSTRARFVEQYYRDNQDTDLSLSDFREIRVNDRQGWQLQAIWESPPTAWPAGGPFITRVVRCPEQNRDYFMDAWLFAPGKDKYEFMLQLQTILDSFRCG